LLEINAESENYHRPSNGRPAQQTKRGVVFLDRDGVIVADLGYISDPGRLEMISGAASAIRALQQQFRVIVVTNQSGIARGMFTEDNLVAIHRALINDLATQGAIVDGFYFCPHLPGAPVTYYDRICDCRKPGPGMLIRAETDWNIDLKQSYMVGDRASDMEAAAAAGVTGIIITDNDEDGSVATMKAKDLTEATVLIIADAEFKSADISKQQ
jgi:D-glycero-D-manno-heptose 1,7-bisphosphate phosphatase